MPAGDLMWNFTAVILGRFSLLLLIHLILPKLVERDVFAKDWLTKHQVNVL